MTHSRTRGRTIRLPSVMLTQEEYDRLIAATKAGESKRTISSFIRERLFVEASLKPDLEQHIQEACAKVSCVAIHLKSQEQTTLHGELCEALALLKQTLNP